MLLSCEHEANVHTMSFAMTSLNWWEPTRWDSMPLSNYPKLLDFISRLPCFQGREVENLEPMDEIKNSPWLIVDILERGILVGPPSTSQNL